MNPQTAARIRWILLALVGLIAAIAVGVAAAALTSSRIGLSSEPIRAGEDLAPKSVHRDDHRGGRGRDHPEDGPHHGSDDTTTTTDDTTVSPATTTTPPATTAPPATTTPQTSTSDDSAGSEGGDDD